MRHRLVVAGLLAAACALPSPAAAQGRDLSITIGPGGVRVETERDRDRRDWRPRCLERHDVRNVIERQGWRDLHDWDWDRDSVKVKGRQWGGLFRLRVDNCYGQLIEANRIGWDRDRWGRDHDRGWDRDRRRR